MWFWLLGGLLLIVGTFIWSLRHPKNKKYFDERVFARFEYEIRESGDAILKAKVCVGEVPKRCVSQTSHYWHLREIVDSLFVCRNKNS